MAHEHTEKCSTTTKEETCSTALVVREMQIKTTMKYHYMPVGMTKIKNSDNTKCWRECGDTGSLRHCWWECKMGQPFWKSGWQLL